MSEFTFPLAPSPQNPATRASVADSDLGVDIMCEEDLDPQLRLVGGVRNVAWALAWRIRTPRGELFYSPDYGRGLVGYCHDEVDRQTLHACRSGLESEALKDDRVRTASSSVRWTPATRTLSTSLVCHSAAGPFRLIGEVSRAATIIRVQT
jgi:hypothetical protein